MTFKILFVALASASLCPLLCAQQTGVAVGTTPGSAIRNFPRGVPGSVPKTSCDSQMNTSGSNTSPALPDLVFTRESLLCVRHSDGRFEQLLNNAESGVTSSDGKYVANWIPDKHELHVFSVAERHDAIVDTLPRARIREMVWSLKGHTLSYYATEEKKPIGVRVIDVDSGRRNSFPGGFGSLIPSPDPDYVFVMALSIERLRLTDGHRDVILPARNAARAVYSREASFLGIVAYTTVPYLDKAPEPSANAAAGAADDGPDCTGADFFLILQSAATKQLIDVPFPEKFNSVLDFEFSPDESSIAVTFGVTGCDYPGDAARVYKVSLPGLQMTPISPADRLGVQAHWSPDGEFIVYSDYTGSDSPLFAADVRTGRLTRLTNPGLNGPDYWQAWR